MKKIFFMLSLIFLVLFLMGCGVYTPDTQSKIEQSQKELLNNSNVSVPLPEVSYYQERRTIAKWTERWDVPSLPTYVYLISFGKIIGYYVCDGKPASTRSYLIPEEHLIRADLGEYNGEYLASAPDIDGTYGENNPGIRFFTAGGTAVEWAGSGASYIYSDVPLPIDVPRLNPKAEEKK